MDKRQEFRRWMFKNQEEYGRSSSEYDYDSFAAGWRIAVRIIEQKLDELNGCNQSCRYFLKKELDKLT